MAKKDTKVEETTAMTTTGETSIGTAIDYGDDAVALGDDALGYEGQTTEDTALPFIKMVQSGTPELKKKLIKGLEEGDWLNPVTGRVWKNPQGLIWISAMTRHEYVEYVPLDAGGGFKGRYSIDSPEVARAKAESKKFGKYNIGPIISGTEPPLRNELVETFLSFGVFCDEEMNPLGIGMLGFKSTGIKCYKNWMSTIRMHTIPDGKGGKRVPPMYAHAARFTTMQKEEGKQIWTIPIYSPAVDGDVNKSLLHQNHPAFLMARSVYESVKAGTVKVDYDKMQSDHAAEGSGADAEHSAF